MKHYDMAHSTDTRHQESIPETSQSTILLHLLGLLYQSSLGPGKSELRPEVEGRAGAAVLEMRMLRPWARSSLLKRGWEREGGDDGEMRAQTRVQVKSNVQSVHSESNLQYLQKLQP